MAQCCVPSKASVEACTAASRKHGNYSSAAQPPQLQHTVLVMSEVAISLNSISMQLVDS